MVGAYVDSKVVAVKCNNIKFLCSYGGKILPRYPDGKLRYIGGETRVLAVDRSISFSELLVKFGELCRSTICLRCQLPTEDLDALVSITSDEDLVNLIEEYDRVAQAASAPLKIRAFISPLKSIKKNSPPLSATASDSVVGSSAGKYSYADDRCRTSILPGMAGNRCVHQFSTSFGLPVHLEKSTGAKLHYYNCLRHESPRHVYIVNSGNRWQ